MYWKSDSCDLVTPDLCKETQEKERRGIWCDDVEGGGRRWREESGDIKVYGEANGAVRIRKQLSSFVLLTLLLHSMSFVLSTLLFTFFHVMI